MFKFKIVAKDSESKARAGILHTDHGIIQTPIFMPVGTVGTVKAVEQQVLEDEIGAQIILGNTYHLYLRPGLDILYQAGGLHKFISWNRPILTDSGGFQVYSLAQIRKITDNGVRFKSHIDGSYHVFTPESNLEIQRKIGADIIMALDECVPFPSSYEYAKESLNRTLKWLKRGWKHYKETEPLYGYYQAFFPITQGSVFKDLRIRSTETVANYQADGYAIGGLAVGEPEEKMYEIIDLSTDILPEERPRYLMGVGTPANILNAIELGVDMFDCVMPTRNARNAQLFTSQGVINIRNSKWKNDFSPIDPLGITWVDTKYTKAYLRHLVIAGERLAAQIASVHNLGFYLWLVRQARMHIIQGDYPQWKRQILPIITRRL
jgi:queuine tRNA-ribosyltransferase